MRRLLVALIGILLLLVSCQSATDEMKLAFPEDATARIVYFYADDCPYCATLYEEILTPLTRRCGKSLEIKAIQVDSEQGYQVFVETEKALIGESGRWETPAIVVDDRYFIGENAIRNGLIPQLQCVLGEGGNAWPDVPSLLSFDEPNNLVDDEGVITGTDDNGEACITDEDVAVCASPTPIFVLYFSTAECKDTCDRTRYDLKYLRGVYPSLFFEEKDIEKNTNLAKAIVNEFGLEVPEERLAPAIVVGTDYLTGDEMSLENLKSVLEKYSESGALAMWYTLKVE